MNEQLGVMNPITDGRIGRAMFRYFLPLVAGTIFQQIYSLADAVIVGRFVGKAGLAAIGGSASTVLYIVTMVFTSMFAGASVTLSQYFGAWEEKKLHEALHTMVIFGILASAVTTVLGVALSRWAMVMMRTPESLMTYSVQYMVIYFGGVSTVILYNMGSSILRAIGDSKRPFHYLIVCCVLNIVLDILFVVVWKKEVIGAGLATVISQGVSAFLVMRALVRNKEMEGIPFRLSLRVRDLKEGFNGMILKHQMRLGTPGSIQAVAYGISNILIQACINGFGEDIVAAWAAYFKTDVIIWAILNAFGVTVTTFVGQNYGAGKKERIFQSVRVGLVQSSLLVVAIVILLMSFAHPLLSLFLTDEDVIQIGVTMMHQFMPWYVLSVILEIFNGALRGLGDVKIPTIITTCCILGLRIPWVTWIVPAYHEVLTVILSYPMTWSLALMMIIPYYLHRKKQMGRDLW
ncbi:MAG: MATE family efflux transporter [Clostridia bacterium]|nr:MATE family efflux transporter [Clostridia bacterium]